jgi:hypothetical protein
VAENSSFPRQEGRKQAFSSVAKMRWENDVYLHTSMFAMWEMVRRENVFFRGRNVEVTKKSFGVYGVFIWLTE